MAQLFATIGEKVSTERGIGVIWVRGSREVLYHSDFAKRQLTDGPMRIDEDGLLEIVDLEERHSFWDLVSREIRIGLRNSRGMIIGKSRPNQQFITFTATQGNSCAIMVRSVEHSSENSHARLVDLFELTKREAQLALHLGGGKSLDDFARTHFLTMNTVKTHLKQLFKKTGAKKQMQLAVTVWAALR